MRDITNYRFVDVRLDRPVDEPTLRAIAQEVRQQSPDHPVVHVLYYLPGMANDAGAWATTRFERGQPIQVRMMDFMLTPTATPTSAPRPTPTPTPVVTYAACDDVPTYLLRLDTQGRVAVQRELVPSQPDGDDDGFACGDQLEHKRKLIAATPTAARTASVDCPTSAEARYLRDFAREYSALGEAAITLGEAFRDLESNPQIFTTDEFALMVGIQAGEILLRAQNIADLTPPNTDRGRAFSRTAAGMASRISTGVSTLIKGLDALDSDTIDRGVRQLAVALEWQVAVNDGIERFCR